MLELMVTILVMYVIIAFSYPSYREFTVSSAAATQANTFLGMLNRARNEAGKRGLKVVLCKSANGSTCDTAVTNGWQEGWIGFVDVDGDNVRTPPNETLIVSHPAVANFTISGTGIMRNYVPFFPPGVTRSAGTISICNGNAVGINALRKRNVTIIASGRAVINAQPKQVSCP